LDSGGEVSVDPIANLFAIAVAVDVNMDGSDMDGVSAERGVTDTTGVWRDVVLRGWDHPTAGNARPRHSCTG